MTQKKLLSFILGIAILGSIICSSIIIVTGIQNRNTASDNSASSQQKKAPQPYILKKTEIEEFSEVSINLDYADIFILPSDGFYLEYRLIGTCKEPDYDVSNGKLSFREGPALERYSISFNLFGNPANRGPFYLNLYVPEDHYFELLSLSVESGNVELEQINAKKADLSLDYGDLNLGNFTGSALSISSDSGNIETKTITCDDLSISTSSGDITGGSISLSNKASLSIESGNLELSQLTADTLSIHNDYGNCNIDSITIKKGNFSLDSGNLNLKNAALESAEINSEYGDVTLKLTRKSSDYNYDLESEYGTIEIDGQNIKADEDGVVSYQKQDNQKKNNIQIHCDSGNIDIR